MNTIGIGSIVEGVGQIADDLFTSEEEKLKLRLQDKALDIGLMQGQLEVNKAEAQHKSLFVAGWRPFIGWVGGLALAYQFLLYPFLQWFWALAVANSWLPAGAIEPQPFDAGPLFAIVTGMLGIGGMRSYDKLKNTESVNIGFAKAGQASDFIKPDRPIDSPER